MADLPLGLYGDIGPSDNVETTEGRKDPASFTLQRREAFLAALAAGMTRSAACRRVGVSHNTFYRAYRASSAFANAVDLAERESWDVAVAGLRDAVIAKEPWAIQFVLKRHRLLAEEWDGERAQTVNVKVSGTVQHELSSEGIGTLVRELVERRQELEDVGVIDLGPDSVQEALPKGDSASS